MTRNGNPDPSKAVCCSVLDTTSSDGMARILDVPLEIQHSSRSGSQLRNFHSQIYFMLAGKLTGWKAHFCESPLKQYDNI